MLSSRLGHEGQALPHLPLLEESGKGRQPFILGIWATRQGDFKLALQWMERALELNPSHEATIQQVEALKHAVAETSTPHEMGKTS